MATAPTITSNAFLGNQTPAPMPAGPVQSAVPAAPKVLPAPSAPAVVTAAPAIADVNKKMAVINDISGSRQITPQPMATVVNPATGQRAAVPVGSEQAQAYFRSGFILETPKNDSATATPSGTAPTGGTGTAPGAAPAPGEKKVGPDGITPLPDAPVAPDQKTAVDQATADFNTANDASLAESAANLADFKTQVQQLRDGTFPLTPFQQDQITNITKQFEGLVAEQQRANKAMTNAMKMQSNRLGFNVTSPVIDTQIINSTINAGVKAIADIDLKMSMAINDAKQAFLDDNMKLLNSVYDKVEKYQEEKRKSIQSTYDKTKDALDAAQTKFTNDMATQEFEFKTAVELNKPILEAAKEAKDFLYDRMKQYPDADFSSITPQDTMAEAGAKAKAAIEASDSYKAEKETERLQQENIKANIEQSKASAAASYASAAKSRADAARASGDADGLSKRAKQILDNPSLLYRYTATEQGKILDEFANNNVEFDAAGLEKVTGTLRKNVAQYDSIESQAAKALELVNQVDTGLYAGNKGRIDQVFGKASPEFTAYNSAISDMNSVLVLLRSGAAVTDSEFKRIKGFIPSITEDEKTAAQKIPLFIEAIASAKRDYINRATQTTKQMMDSTKVPAEATSSVDSFSNAKGMSPADVKAAEADGWKVTKNPDGTYSGTK